MRRIFRLLLVLAGLAVAGPALAVAIVHPDWVVKPSADTLSRYYPDAAQRKGIGGKAVIACPVSTEGRLHDCRVVSEAPPGMGFGPAAVAASATFRMSPEMRGGQPVEGAVVIPVTFAPPSHGPSDMSRAAARVVDPGWIRKPSADELARYYPAEAMRRNLGGQARIGCRLADDGVLTDCKVLSEAPAGAGFGKAALDLSSRFQMRPKVADGRRVQSRIIVPITFAPPAADALLPVPWRWVISDLILVLVFSVALMWMVSVLSRRSLANSVRGGDDARPPTAVPTSAPPYIGAVRPTDAPFATDIIFGGPVSRVADGGRTLSRRGRRGLRAYGGPIGLFCALLIGVFGVMVFRDVALIAPVRDDLRQLYRSRPVTVAAFKSGGGGSACGRYLAAGDPKPWRFFSAPDGVWTEQLSMEWRDPAASARLEARWRACETDSPASGEGPAQLTTPVALWFENHS